jgi:hypothetical protein
MTNIFEQATREHLRFDTTIGTLTVEDLWELPLTSKTKLNLDDVAKATNRLIRETEEDSFVTKNETDSALILMMDIVKHIISVKLAEKDKLKEARESQARRKLLVEALHEKEIDSIKSMSEEDLKKELTNC